MGRSFKNHCKKVKFYTIHKLLWDTVNVFGNMVNDSLKVAVRMRLMCPLHVFMDTFNLFGLLKAIILF